MLSSEAGGGVIVTPCDLFLTPIFDNRWLPNGYVIYTYLI